MDFRQLRNLVFVARHGSFGIAANALNVTQPALSKSLRALEQSIGVRLLDRGPWGVKPTEYGNRLIEYGEVILSLSDEARNELDAMRGARRGLLRVGANATAMREIVPKATRQFLGTHPDVAVTLNEELSPALLNLLINGSLDLAVMTRPRDFPAEEIEFRTILEIPVDIVADRGHPLASKQTVNTSDLCAYDWILPARPDPDRLALDSLFATAQLPLPQAACETTSSNLQIAMLIGSNWLSYLTRTSAYAHAADAKLTPLNMSGPTWTRQIGIAIRRKSVMRPVVNAYLKAVDAISGDIQQRSASA
ncbi:LysR family transcriptional regulator [Devosia elaeis]|uniref:LysR family transcriptional regulator n=1 Tax=Devosia elaeis TaxID=1770058 RepID=A0A178I430_9HYPH|nr:LysR family transcriptional regulator [Devosia elaeis]OAM79054.1 LysR family transcriptional regulator [Devosia elaeis]